MITFAIPYVGGAAYLRRAIESVRAQRGAGWELVICDNSRDGEAGALAAAYDDARITVRRLAEPLTIAGNWNCALESGSGELVTILHSDDELLPEYGALMCSAAQRRPEATAFFCGARIIGPEGGPRFSFADWTKRFLEPPHRGDLDLRGEDAVRALVRGNFIMCPTLCYRRSRLGEHRFLPRWRQVLDLELTTRLLMEGHVLIGVAAVGYAYRRHAASATTQQSESLVRFDEEARLYEELSARCEALGWKRAAAVARAKTIIRLHLLYAAASDLLGRRWMSAGAKLRFLRSLA